MSQKSELVPKRRFKEFENAGDWEQRKLSEITTKIGSGKTPKGGSSVYVQAGIALLRSQNIFDNKVHFDNVVYISTEMDNEMLNSRVEKNDILLNITGASIGRTAVYEIETPANVNQHVCIIRPQSFANPVFIQSNLSSDVGQKQIELNQAGGGREGLNFQQISKLAFNYPSIEEQNKIGKFFKNLDDTITLHQHKLDKLNNLKQSYLYQMFPQSGEKVPSLRFSEFSEEWKSNSMGELGKTYTGLNGKTKDDFGHGKAKFVTYVNVYKNTISNPNLVEEVELDSRQNEVKYGDVLFTTSSETPEEVGLSSVWLNNSENVYLNSFCFGYRPSINIDYYYLAYMLRSQSIRKKLYC